MNNYTIYFANPLYVVIETSIDKINAAIVVNDTWKLSKGTFNCFPNKTSYISTRKMTNFEEAIYEIGKIDTLLKFKTKYIGMIFNYYFITHANIILNLPFGFAVYNLIGR